MATQSSTPGFGRQVSVDALRGLAIFGIFVVNVPYMAHPGMSGGQPLGDGVVERFSVGLIGALFELKFWAMFSLLFGVGAIIQRQRSEASGREFGPKFFRRMGFLAFFGLLHGLFLFIGDVLLLYALIGMATYPLQRTRAKTLIWIGVALLLAVSLLSIGAASLEPASPPSGEPAKDYWSLVDMALNDDPRLESVELEAYGAGPMSLLLQARAAGFTSWMFLCLLLFGWRVAGTFLIGMGMEKLQALRNIDAMKQLAFWGMGLGLPLEIACAAFSQNTSGWVGALAQGVHPASSVVLMFGFVGSIVWLAESGRFPRMVSALASVGRMGLSHYILQSVIANVVFCYFGLGQFGQWGHPAMLGFCVAVFVVQIAISRLWLSRFRMGPLEWLWRWGTEGARPSFRRLATGTPVTPT